MRMINSMTSLIVILFLSATIFAQVDYNDLTGTYGFDEMEIIKLDWDVQYLRIADFNKDGKNDFAVVNNRKAKVEIFTQQNEIADQQTAVEVSKDDIDINIITPPSRFKKHDVAVSQKIFNFVCGDLNSDGLPDLAFYGEPKGLYIIEQKKAEKDNNQAQTLNWLTRNKIDITDGLASANGLICADLNNDQKADLALAGSDCVYIITQKNDGSLSQSVKYPSTNRVLGLEAADLNGDGINDLVIITSDSEKMINVRFGQKDGNLGPQLQYSIEKPWKLEMADLDKDPAHELLAIEARSGRLACYKLIDSLPQDQDWPIFFYPLAAGQLSTKRDMVIADFDGDNLDDVIISDPGAAELIFFKQVHDIGLAKPIKFPAFSEITSLSAADLNGDSQTELAVLSVKEKTLGISVMTNNRMTFPKPIETEGEPLAMDLADLDNDKKIDCIYIVKDPNDERFLNVIYDLGSFAGLAKEKWFSSKNDKKQVSLKLQKLKSNPDGIKIIDVDQDGLKDILIFIPYEQPLLVLQKKPQVFEPVDSTGTQAGLIKDATMQSIALADIDGNKKEEMLLAQKNFARSLKMSEELSWQIVDQYNAKSTENTISAAAAFKIDNETQRPAILLLDGQKGRLQILQCQPDNTYRFEKELEVGKWNSAQHLKILQASLSGSGSDSIVLFDGEKFALITKPTAQNGLSNSIQQQFSYETKIKDGIYGNFAVGDINNDGQTDIVMVEYKNNHIEVLTLNKKGLPVPAMRFKLFEQKGYRESNAGKSAVEPRELIIADLTADGKNDLITVIHDRVIIYPQD